MAAIDVLQVHFDIIIDNAMQKMHIVANQIDMINRSMNELSNLRGMEQSLATVGVSANRMGQYVDTATGKFIKLDEVMNRINDRQMGIEQSAAAKSFRLSDMGIDQASTSKSVSAQQLINQATAESAANTAHMQKNMGMFNAQSQKSLTIMQALGDQSKSIGILMGLLFGGMMMKQWGTSIMRFVLPQMDKINNYTSEGTKRVNAMRASFEFLKFSMFEAFTSTPLFRTFVDLIISGSNWIARFVQKYPEVTAIAGAIGGILITLGSIGMILSGPVQVLMLTSLLKELELVDKLMNGITLKAIGAGVVGALSWLLTPLGIAVGLATVLSFGILRAYDKFPELQTQGETALNAIKEAGGQVISDFFKLFGITVDLNDELYFLGTTFNVVLGVAARGANAILQGFSEIMQTIKAIGQVAALAIVTIASAYHSFFGDPQKAQQAANMAAGISEEIDQTMVDSAQSRADFLARDQELAEQIAISREGMLYGRDAAIELTNALSNTTTATALLSTENLPVLSDQLTNTGQVMQNSIIDRWENWTPSQKELKIKVSQSGSGGPSFSPASPVSTMFRSSITRG